MQLFSDFHFPHYGFAGTQPLMDASQGFCCNLISGNMLLSGDLWQLFSPDRWTLLQYWGQYLSLQAATCPMAACFAWESIARPAVTLSPSNANSAQNGAACCQSPRMDVGACASDIYLDEERTARDLFQRKHRENAAARHFSLFPPLRFSIWIKWGVHVGRQAAREGEKKKLGVLRDSMQEKRRTSSSHSKCCFQQLWNEGEKCW